MRVVIVAGICVKHDAISNSIADQTSMLRELPMVDHVTVITQFSNRALEADDVVHIGDAWQLIRHPSFVAADVVIFHWGITYELFDAVAILSDDPRIIVHFHNVTPVDLADGEGDTLARSLNQAQLLAVGMVRVWAVSEYNAQTLQAWGVDPRRIVVVPLCVERPEQLTPAQDLSRSDKVRLLTVGRLVRSKGADVLVEALRLLPARTTRIVELRFASNSSLSDPNYRQELEIRIELGGLGDTVQFVDNASEAELWGLYDWADVVVSPSLHEGLCVPIIEGYLSGCRAVGTTAGNLPNMVVPPDPVAEPGDAEALARSLEFIIDDVAAGKRSIPEGATALVQRFARRTIQAQLGYELVLARDRIQCRSVS